MFFRIRIAILSTLLALLNHSAVNSQAREKVDSLLASLTDDKLTKNERAICLRHLAFYHPELDSSLYFAKRSLVMAKAARNPILEAEAYEEISHIQHEFGNNTASLKASLSALDIYETAGLEDRQAASYTQLATNYMSNEDYNLAIDYLEKAKEVYHRLNIIENELFTLLNLGEAHRLAGNFKIAEFSFRQVLQMNGPIRNAIAEAYSLGNLGMTLFAQNKIDSAEKNLNKALKILTPEDDTYSVSIYLNTLGEIYSKNGLYAAAEEKMLNAIHMAKREGLKEQIRDFSSGLSAFYHKREQFQKAYHYQKLYQTYNDSLLNKANIQKIEQLKADYEINKRESEIGLLQTITNKQEKWVTLLIVSIVIILFVLYLLFQTNRIVQKANKRLSVQKETIRKSEQEKILLLQELNHRVKNNLQMISSLLNLQSRELTGGHVKEAITAGRNRVDALSLVHRKLYQVDLETRVCLKEYMQELVLGLFHAYNARFEPTFKIPAISVGIDQAIPLALLMNEMIVNALKYAYVNTNQPELIIRIEESNSLLNIQVVDNGIGFTTKETDKENSFGIKLINSLVTQLKGNIQKMTTAGTHWNINIKTAYNS